MRYQGLLDEFVRKSGEIIKNGLTGIYLHGSMAMGCFHPEKSDLDLIVVIEDEISDEQKMAFMRHIVALNGQAPSKGLEISVVKREYCNPFVYPTPFELHFSPTHLQWFREDSQGYVEKMRGEDIDLAAHFTVIRKCGIVLWGEEIEDVFAPVPWEDYLDSIRADVEGAKEHILEQPIYITLNLCRVLAAVKEGLCLSKAEGGKWGIAHLPSEYHSILREALECYASDRDMIIKEKDAVRFAKRMLRSIAAGGDDDAQPEIANRLERLR